MSAVRRYFLVLSLLCMSSPRAAELVLLVDTSTEMPMTRFEHGQLVEGIQKDLGMALGQGMGRDVRFVPLPRKRIAQALRDGQADGVCRYLPPWLDGEFDWSVPFIPVVEVLISDRAVARPRAIGDLAGQPIGTVLGFKYSEMDAALGPAFVRADVSTNEVNLRKLEAGHIHHLLVGKTLFDYRMKQGDLKLTLHPPLVVSNFMAQCAVSRKGRVPVAEFDRAIAQLLKDGGVTTILRRYQ